MKSAVAIQRARVLAGRLREIAVAIERTVPDADRAGALVDEAVSVGVELHHVIRRDASDAMRGVYR